MPQERAFTLRRMSKVIFLHAFNEIQYHIPDMQLIFVQKLKAALDEALTTFVRISSNVAPMFEMLLLAVIVRPTAPSDAPPSLARADITFQLNEIEARSSLHLI